MQWNVKRVMTWTPVQVGGEYTPVAALVKPHPTLSSVHMLNINPPMHNPSGHLPHTFYIAHLQGLKIPKYKINPTLTLTLTLTLILTLTPTLSTQSILCNEIHCWLQGICAMTSFSSQPFSSSPLPLPPSPSLLPSLSADSLLVHQTHSTDKGSYPRSSWPAWHGQD